MMRGLRADLRHAVRLYAATPVASAVAAGVLALSMAVLTTFVSLWSDLVLEGDAGFAASRELVTIGQNDGDTLTGVSLALLERVNDEVGSLSAVAGSASAPQYVDGDRQQPIAVELVTARYFSDIRPEMQLGRAFDARDHTPDAEPVVIISDAYWHERYGARASVLGESLRLSGPDFVLGTREGTANAADTTQDYRIVGVTAPGVTGTFSHDTKAWMPYEQAAATFFAALGGRYRDISLLRGVGRLSPGSRSATVTAELEDRYGETDLELGVQPNRRLDAMAGLVADVNAQRDVERQVRLFLAGSVLLALVAGCNVSLFLLSRAPGRRRELGVRLAVGAPLKRLARQLATEAGLLVVAATLIGVTLSLWLAVLVRELPFLSGPYWRSVSPLDWPVLAILACGVLALTLLVSLAPVVGLRRLGIASSSRASTARAGLAQRLAGTVQIAVAGMLGAAALAFGSYLAALAGANRGFDVAGVYAVRPQLERRAFIVGGDQTDAILAERERRRARIEALPGVEGVAFGTAYPGFGDGPMLRSRLRIPDSPGGPDDTVDVVVDSADYAFAKLLEMPIVDGRLMAPDERDGVLVNEALARALWGRTDVAGERLQLGPAGLPIVGVVRDASYGHPADEIRPRVLHPSIGAAVADQILIRTRLTAAELREGLQGLVDAGELEFAIADIRRVADLVGAELAPDRARTGLTAAAAALVVALAAFGFYGTQRYLVSAGRREFAIRAALGAGPRALGRLVLARGLRLALPGLVLGTLLAFVLVAWLRGGFVSTAVSPYEVTLLVAAGLAALVVAASLGPARRTQRMRAGLVLREE